MTDSARGSKQVCMLFISTLANHVYNFANFQGRFVLHDHDRGQLSVFDLSGELSSRFLESKHSLVYNYASVKFIRIMYINKLSCRYCNIQRTDS